MYNNIFYLIIVTFFFSLSNGALSQNYDQSSSILFIDSGQSLGNYCSWNVALGDVDNDGDLDAFVCNWIPGGTIPVELWLNDGNGTFTKSSQLFPSSQENIALADLDNDGDIDAWISRNYWENSYNAQIWRNDGLGNFELYQENLLSGNTSLGDLDSDGDIDALIVNYEDGINIYFNDGSGHFAAGSQSLSQPSSTISALADFDNDGDLDAYVGSVSSNYNLDGLPDRIWINDGTGNFFDSGQRLGNYQPEDIDLGDIDGDGDIDAFISNIHRAPDPSQQTQPNILYLNDGGGMFTDSQHDVGLFTSPSADLGDIDSDGDLDIVIFIRLGEYDPGDNANRIMINDGNGIFSDSGLRLGNLQSTKGILGDLDGDADLDIFETNCGYPPNGQPNKVWYNNSTTFYEDVTFNMPETFQLWQNYPNPFNPSTKISYQIPELNFVSLKVYDVLGNEITTLVNEEKSAGTYEINFMAKNLPTGIYFYQLISGHYTETKKLIVVK